MIHRVRTEELHLSAPPKQGQWDLTIDRILTLTRLNVLLIRRDGAACTRLEYRAHLRGLYNIIIIRTNDLKSLPENR